MRSTKRDFDKSPITYTREHFMQNSKTNSANSATPPDETEKPRQTSRNIASRARRIDRTTLAEIAQLCAKGLLQGEACRKIGVNPKSFLSWKSRNNHNERWAALLERFRAIRFDALITKIDNAADGVNMKQPDWRAAHAALMIGDKRFNPSIHSEPQSVVNNTQINVVFREAASLIYGPDAVKALSPQSTRKVLPEPTPEAQNKGVADFISTLKPVGKPRP